MNYEEWASKPFEAGKKFRAIWGREKKEDGKKTEQHLIPAEVSEGIINQTYGIFHQY